MDKLVFNYNVILDQVGYDSKEMSTLVNGVVNECKEQGIATLDELEIDKMIGEWNK